jgi:hypothetical protein
VGCISFAQSRTGTFLSATGAGTAARTVNENCTLMYMSCRLVCIKTCCICIEFSTTVSNFFGLPPFCVQSAHVVALQVALTLLGSIPHTPTLPGLPLDRSSMGAPS